MKNVITLLTAAALISSLGFVGTVSAQTTKQTITLNEIDPMILATGWRASAIIGADIFNDAGEEIGKLEDMIITSTETVPYVVISVGGFMGVNAHHVVVEASSLEMIGNKLTLHGATTESLKALPNFEFAS